MNKTYAIAYSHNTSYIILISAGSYTVVDNDQFEHLPTQLRVAYLATLDETTIKYKTLLKLHNEIMT